jgi:hypothetical protein
MRWLAGWLAGLAPSPLRRTTRKPAHAASHACAAAEKEKRISRAAVGRRLLPLEARWTPPRPRSRSQGADHGPKRTLSISTATPYRRRSPTVNLPCCRAGPPPQTSHGHHLQRPPQPRVNAPSAGTETRRCVHGRSFSAIPKIRAEFGMFALLPAARRGETRAPPCSNDWLGQGQGGERERERARETRGRCKMAGLYRRAYVRCGARYACMCVRRAQSC